jgi:ABC-type bacteriocin/lantibiotic exporter with double-glycine peptidase domain
VFENRIRDVVTGLLNPTMKRVEESRDRIRETFELSLDMSKVQTEFDQRINELHSDKVESFRFKVMEEISTKYLSIKIECEKRE